METSARRNHTLGILLAEATRSFFAPNSVEDTLSRVTASAVDLIDSVDCADILVVSGTKGIKSHAATSELPLRLDSLQETFGEGPCVDAAQRKTLVRSDDLATDARWPRFGPAATQAGVHSTLSFQLYTSDGSMGALNLYALTTGAFSEDDEEVGAMLATHAAVALYAANKTEQFTSALASRDLIGQAKGMIMERYGLDAVAAFDLLAKLSQDANVPVIRLAADVVRLGSETANPG